MEARPWYKKLVSKAFKRDQRNLLPIGKVSHDEFPAANASTAHLKTNDRVATVRRKRRRRYRNPPISQEPSSDPRFNHSLRRIMNIQQ